MHTNEWQLLSIVIKNKNKLIPKCPLHTELVPIMPIMLFWRKVKHFLLYVILGIAMEYCYKVAHIDTYIGTIIPLLVLILIPNFH